MVFRISTNICCFLRVCWKVLLSVSLSPVSILSYCKNYAFSSFKHLTVMFIYVVSTNSSGPPSFLSTFPYCHIQGYRVAILAYMTCPIKISTTKDTSLRISSLLVNCAHYHELLIPKFEWRTFFLTFFLATSPLKVSKSKPCKFFLLLSSIKSVNIYISITIV